MVDIFSQEERNILMSRVKNRNTNIELIVRKELYKRGYRYRINYKLFGKPDIVFPGKKIAIFCDGDFWHGKNFEKEKGNYKQFWIDKINNNIKRDELVNKTLIDLGWTVIRLWKTDILQNLSGCIGRIEKYLRR